MDPVEQFVNFTRAELAKAGLERVDFDGNVYWRGGSGDPLVLLHGVNDQAGTWCSVIPLLVGSSVPRVPRFLGAMTPEAPNAPEAPEEPRKPRNRGTDFPEEPRNPRNRGTEEKGHRLIVPDLAGHGESAPHDGPIAMSDIVARLHAILEREDAQRVTLAGNSMGGWIAMLYAFEHPDRVARLVLEDASGMTWPVPVPLFAQNREQAMVMLRAVHGPSMPIPDWMIDALLARATASPLLRVAQAGVLPYLVDAKLPSLKTPTTLVWGRDDGLLPVAYAEALKEKIAGAELFVIDGAAHIPHRQQPERFVECLNKSFSPTARG